MYQYVFVSTAFTREETKAFSSYMQSSVGEENTDSMLEWAFNHKYGSSNIRYWQPITWFTPLSQHAISEFVPDGVMEAELTKALGGRQRLIFTWRCLYVAIKDQSCRGQGQWNYPLHSIQGGQCGPWKQRLVLIHRIDMNWVWNRVNWECIGMCWVCNSMYSKEVHNHINPPCILQDFAFLIVHSPTSVLHTSTQAKGPDFVL